MRRLFATAATAWLCFLGTARAQERPTTPDDPKQVPQKIDLSSKDKVKSDTDTFVVPMPSEIVRGLRQSKVGAQLHATIGGNPHRYDALPAWRVALTLGVSLADLILSVDTLSADRMVAGLDDVVAGMSSLKVEQKQIDKVRRLRARVQAGGLGKDQLMSELDGMRVELLGAGRKQLGAQNFAVLAVGGWARAANLAARVAQGNPAGLMDLEILKVRAVINTLISWLGTGATVQPLVAALNKIVPITAASRPAPPTAEEAAIVRAATDEILAFVPGKGN